MLRIDNSTVVWCGVVNSGSCPSKSAGVWCNLTLHLTEVALSSSFNLIVWHRWNSCLGRTPHIQVQGHKSKTRGVYFITFISIVGYTSERALMSLPHSHDAEWLKIQLLMVKRLKSCLSFFFASLHQLEFSPQTLCCYGKQLCTIPRDAAYFSYQNRYGGRREEQ